MAATDARPIPRKGVAYRVYFPILDADGDLVTGAADLDSEVSKDGAAFADCTNEATEIGSSGMYYLDLTSSEMNADAVVLVVKTSTEGAKTTPIVFYPEESGDVRADLTLWKGTAPNDLDSGKVQAVTSAGAGTGARTVTVTVDDSTDPLENAVVRLSEGLNSYIATTNASGVATFALDDATYSLAVTKDGYTYTPSSQVVNGDEAWTVSMAALSITPAAAGQTTLYITALDATGAPLAGVDFFFTLVTGPGTAGQSPSQQEKKATSAASTGLVQQAVLQGATYAVRRGSGKEVQVVVGTSATQQLPEVLGLP